MFKHITLAELQDRMTSAKETLVWNVLTPQYFRGEMIPGSEWIPLDTIGREVKTRGIARDAAIVVYCAGPTCPQSGFAAEKLVALGYTNVAAFEGGIEEWKSSGLPLERLEGVAV